MGLGLRIGEAVAEQAGALTVTRQEASTDIPYPLRWGIFVCPGAREDRTLRTVIRTVFPDTQLW
jgi:hypothetical protein